MKRIRVVRAALLGASLGAFLGACLSGCRATTYEDHGLGFQVRELVTGRARSQAIVPGFFLDGAMADLAVVSVDERHGRRLHIYALEDGSWVSRVDALLDPGVLFVDAGNIGGRDRLITVGSGRVSAFDPDSGTEEQLLGFASCIRATDRGQLPRLDITRDLNHDGRDDLVLPDVDGFWISTQSSDGSFRDPVKLGAPEPFLDEIALEDTRTYGEVGITTMTLPWYLSRVHEVDYDHDGRSDLVFWNEDHFDVHLQDARGSFDPVARSFPVDVPFDSDGIYSHIFGYSEESMFSLLLGTRAKSRRTVLLSLQDMNGDGVADLVTHTLEGRSLLRLRSSSGVHFGTPTPGGTEFAADASTKIQSRGSTAAGYQTQELRDLDGDGQVEITLVHVNTGIGQMFRALVGNSITMELRFYRIEDGAYREKPGATRKIRPDIHVFDRRGPFFPTVLGGDVNDDGRQDLLVGQSWEELRVFIGVPGPDLFSRNPQYLDVALTANEQDARLVDLNRDGKQDILVHYPPRKNEPHRLATLIAR